jgi:AhpC/TSA family protein
VIPRSLTRAAIAFVEKVLAHLPGGHVPDLLPVGTKAPAFSLPSTRGQVSLADFVGKHNLVICFYPGDDTPG